MEGLVAMPERRAPRLSDLKRALRWLRAQYQRRAEEAARGQDRMIERISGDHARRHDTKKGYLQASSSVSIVWRPTLSPPAPGLPGMFLMPTSPANLDRPSARFAQFPRGHLGGACLASLDTPLLAANAPEFSEGKVDDLSERLTVEACYRLPEMLR